MFRVRARVCPVAVLRCGLAPAPLAQVKGKGLENSTMSMLPKWRNKTVDACTANGISYSTLAAPPEISGSITFKNLTVREQHAVAIMTTASTRRIIALDTSQCVSRMTPTVLADDKEEKYEVGHGPTRPKPWPWSVALSAPPT